MLSLVERIWPSEFNEKETLKPLWNLLERFSGVRAVKKGVKTFKACSTAGLTLGKAVTAEKNVVEAAL